jgi:hypothetical protein
MKLASQSNPVIPLDLTRERRSETRISADIRARAKSLDPVTSLGPSTVGRIVDISPHGLKVRVDRQFMTGSSVQILAEGKSFLGRVRYCLSLDADFHIGIQLAELGT